MLCENNGKKSEKWQSRIVLILISFRSNICVATEILHVVYPSLNERYQWVTNINSRQTNKILYIIFTIKNDFKNSEEKKGSVYGQRVLTWKIILENEIETFIQNTTISIEFSIHTRVVVNNSVFLLLFMQSNLDSFSFWQFTTG